MNRHHLSTLALVGGLGLLTACPPGGGTTTETTSDESTGTTEAPDPTSTPQTEPTTTGLTTETPDTTTIDPTSGVTEGETDTLGTTTMEPPDAALCEHLGGIEGVGELVSAAIARVLVDDRINGYFLNSDVDGGKLAQCLTDQIGALAGCPGVRYTCLGMQEAHAGMGVSSVDFADFAEDFQAALDEHQGGHPALTDDDKATIVGALSAMEADVVEDPGNDQTVYQRVGRKPAIETLIGYPGEVETFVDRVANDASISGYFTDTNFERFNTCLTRQISSIDGPVDYGQEVDAPSPADPGVSAAEPCRDMASSHEGLVDDTDAQTVGIDINDFLALVTHLVDAMTTFSVPEAEQASILMVLGTMCEDILAPPFKNECPSAQKQEIVEQADLAIDLKPGAYNGTPESMDCRELEVADDGFNYISNVSLTVGITHSWVADLTIKVINPAGDKTLTVLSRPGYNEMKDDGNGCCGKNANLDAAAPLSFKDGSAYEAEQMGTIGSLNNNQVVCVDDDVDPCEWDPSPGKGPGVAFSDFAGVAANGTWLVCVGDSEPMDPGVWQSVKLTLDKVKYDPNL